MEGGELMKPTLVVQTVAAIAITATVVTLSVACGSKESIEREQTRTIYHTTTVVEQARDTRSYDSIWTECYQDRIDSWSHNHSEVADECRRIADLMTE